MVAKEKGLVEMKLSEIVNAIITAYEQKKDLIIEIGDNPFDTQKIKIKFPDIISISPEQKTEETIVVKSKSIVDQILECGDDIKKALRLASDPITVEEEQALDTLVFAKRIKNVKTRIGEQLATKRSKLTVESVLAFLCENILGTNEMPPNPTEKQETAIIKEIANAIEKLDNDDF